MRVIAPQGREVVEGRQSKLNPHAGVLSHTLRTGFGWGSGRAVYKMAGLRAGRRNLSS